ncbi:AMP-binding protein [Bacillus luteolus]|uniref:AMP-binding protein n=1 Tax=Litchfieldia luteola TaxID=682179 RepID=A0ABR9QG69_9BACI|nr:AMP-binding protein [Cytobacillus luteolus]MBE4907488.1 AMP-binding protein [Cytobacillus luteolus]MBP1944256.1 fatty-acyl-CoA synthase/long-chain acyl-CoA synthetase [Cytobacillus luteolus]
MDILKDVTIGQLLKDAVNKYGKKEAIVYSNENIRYTYAEFYEETSKIAKGLMKLGIQKGEHIAIWATNVPEWLLLQYASARIGAVLVTINTSYQSSELEYLLKQSDTTTLFSISGFKGTSYIDIINTICHHKLIDSMPGKLHLDHLPYLKNVIYIGENPSPDGMMNWKDLVTLGDDVSDTVLLHREQSLDPTDVINMQYTSGTTGFPKGVMLTHHNIVNNGHLVARSMKLSAEDRLCIPVPFFHCFGCVLGSLACVSVGATMVPIIEFNPELVLETIEKERCTGLHGVPTMFIAELNHEKFSNYNLSTLRTGIMAGSNCPIEVMKKLINEMGMTDITIAYGQTESSPVITQTTTTDSLERRVNSVGKAHPHVEVKIVDPVTGSEVPRGHQGELCTRGYLVMKGYYKMPDATYEAIDTKGWLHTGDLATMDEDGYVRITGRLKDMIIRGGENVYPREIEEFLYQHDSVLDVQVVGVPDEKYGEKVAACIKVKEGHSITSEDIRSFCTGKLAYYKIPEYFIFVDDYPMTASGKIQKFKLREQASEWISQTAKTV